LLQFPFVEYRERIVVNLSGPMRDRRLARSFKVRHHCAGLAPPRTPVPVKGVWHVEVGCALHPSESKNSVEKFVSAVDARTDRRNVVQPLKSHIGSNLRYGLWPRLCLNPLFVPVALQHLCGGWSVLGSDSIRCLIPAPPGAASSNLDDSAVRIPMINRFEVMAVEGTIH
jgi:hypothetical protein